MTGQAQPQALSVLIIEDSQDDVLLLVRALRKTGYDVRHDHVKTEAETLAALQRQRWDLVMSDHSMPEFDSFRALEIVKRHDRDLPFLIISGSIDEETAVNCMRAGAHDFLTKERLGRLGVVVARELREAAIRRERGAAEAALQESQEQFRQAQKMEAIGRLAGGIAHDFNNLLTAILGYSEFVLGELPEDHPLRGDVTEIRSAGERAARLTRQLLLFSRMQVLEPQLLDFNEILGNIDSLLRRVIGEDIEIVTQVQPGLWPVKGDPGQIEQVIMNLAVNARDAMPEGGRLVLETANVELDEVHATYHLTVEPGPYVMLAVSDTGTGMSPEITSRIFEPFFTTKEKGTGLGLSTVYGIVRQSGGSIWVYSEPGRGSTFKIYLPRAAGSTLEEAAPPADASLRAAHGETVLLVEDDASIRRLIARMLRRYGYTVLEAEGGREAVTVAASHRGRIDLLVTDLVLTDIGGRELADLLQEEGSINRVLFLSGYTDLAMQLQGNLGPRRAFLQKPFAPETLARKVHGVLGRLEEPPGATAPGAGPDRP